jgi:hypothetical protein
MRLRLHYTVGYEVNLFKTFLLANGRQFRSSKKLSFTLVMDQSNLNKTLLRVKSQIYD